MVRGTGGEEIGSELDWKDDKDEAIKVSRKKLWTKWLDVVR